MAGVLALSFVMKFSRVVIGIQSIVIALAALFVLTRPSGVLNHHLHGEADRCVH